MKFNSIKTILKPGLTLFALNSVLCFLFAIAAGLSIGISWIFYEQFGLPFPLMPLTVFAFTALSLAVWVIFGKRLRLGRNERLITAAAGVCPLILISGVALLGALTFISVPGELGGAFLGSSAIGIVALLAAAACTACVFWTPARPVTPVADSPG